MLHPNGFIPVGNGQTNIYAGFTIVCSKKYAAALDFSEKSHYTGSVSASALLERGWNRFLNWSV